MNNYTVQGGTICDADARYERVVRALWHILGKQQL